MTSVVSGRSDISGGGTTQNHVTPVWQWGVFLLVAAVVYLVFREGLERMVTIWAGREEYSHGFLIPVISAFLVWQRSDSLRKLVFSGSWSGIAVVAVGLMLFLVGEYATLITVVQYAFVVVLFGLFLSYMGWRGFRLVAVPLFILFLMIPLPNFLYNNLSSQLQLISSEIGVWVIRLFSISVYLEGNVIDLGSYKLQVVEACSGLRYLFPLMTLGFIMAYFFQAPLWKRVVVFLSTMPLTVLMNSFRIGVIGVTVEYWGEGMAEGFLHDFEGWVIFMACFGLLFIEMRLLMWVTGDRRPMRTAFGIDMPAPPNPEDEVQIRTFPVPFWASTAVLVAALAVVVGMPERVEEVPERESFASYPMDLGEWRGQRDTMETIYVDALKFTDYVMANYTDGSGAPPINWYVAYYDSQRKGQSAHSPRSCLPGGGWRIASLENRTFDDIRTSSGEPLNLNRAVITYGDNTQLVYYWFKQRDRNVTNEYLVKWWLFWDALTRNRTDGALVRLVAPVTASESIDEAEARLQSFLRVAVPSLSRYVPD